MITIDETSVGIWYVELPNFSNWMCATSALPAGNFKLVYRFRWADPLEPGADPFEDIDRKNWYSITTPAGFSRDRVIELVRDTALNLAAHTGIGPAEEILNTGDFKAFMDAFLAKPWAQRRPISSDESPAVGQPQPKENENGV